MTEGSLPWLCTASFISILLAINGVKSALLRGPKIDSVTDVTFTRMKIMWSMFNETRVNGTITGYKVCYKAAENSANISCNLSKMVNGRSTKMTVLDGLTPGTTYNIAVRVNSSQGLEERGPIKNGTTLAGVPTISSISEVTFNSMMINWKMLNENNTNGMITRYQVCYAAAPMVKIDCNSMSRTVNNGTRMIVLRNLKPGTTYYVAVKAGTSMDFGNLGPTMNRTTRNGVPSVGPNITSIADVRANSMRITWNTLNEEEANGTITRYEVCYEASKNVTTVNCSINETVHNVNTTTITLKNLYANTTYTIAVRAGTVEGFGNHGNITSEKTPDGVPSKGPTIISITEVMSNSMKISWKKLSRKHENGTITGYAVCYKASQKLNDLICYPNNTVDLNTSTMLVLENLAAATTYNVAVKAATSLGFGGLGPINSSTTIDGIPLKGASLKTVDPEISKTLKVTWVTLEKDSQTNGEIVKYKVCYDTKQESLDNCIQSEEAGKNDTTLNLTGLNEATLYFVAVKAGTVVGFGPTGNILNGTTLEAKPANGPNITNFTSGSRTLTITWSKLSVDDSNGIITTYEVCYHNGPDSISTCTNGKNVTGVNNTMTDLPGLEPATMYTVAVRAYTAVGSGPFGNNANIITKESEPAKGPFVTKVRTVNSKSLEISWERVDANFTNGNVTGYKVCYATNQLALNVCKNYKDVEGVQTTAFNLTGLNEDTLYFVAIRAGTAAGFGPIGNILNDTTFEAKPAKGPNISHIQTWARRLKIIWRKLNANDSNGKVIRYEVCFAPGSSLSRCSDSRNVAGVTNMTELSKLDPATTYTVAVRAYTKVGPGPLGTRRNATTNESFPSMPRIIDSSIQVSLTSITFKWSPPSPSNGVLILYEICWRVIHVSNSQNNCETHKMINEKSYVIPSLMPGTTYNISISASTKVGQGPLDSKFRSTEQSDLQNKGLSTANVDVSDGTTQIGFKLPEIKGGELSKIQYFYVIVKLWAGDMNEDILRNTPEKLLTQFENSNDGKEAYIAIKDRNYTINMEIVVGEDSTKSRTTRKKRSPTYRNAPLRQNTQYAIFIRVFYDNDGKSFQSSKILVGRTDEKTDSNGSNVTLIVVIVVVLILAILVLTFGVLLLHKRRKNVPPYDGINLQSTPKPPVVRYPIPIGEFRAHCERLGMNTGLGYQDEYESIRPNSQVTAEIAKRQENADKNRYNNIHAYDDTRVILSQIDGEEGSDYINANHIDGFERKNQFIASQGTLKNTIVDFWRMLWEQNVSSIVMLANPIEKGREKLAVYWPQDRAVKHGPYMIKLDGEVELADYVIRKLTVTKDDVKETRQLTQFHYTVWPDHGVPLYTTSLQAFLTRIRKFVRGDSKPLVVHCSAGVGRTGTFIGIFAMLDMIEATKTVDIFNFVCKMRTQRTHMVQVESQYVFLHKAVLEAIECGDTEINAPDLRVKMIQLNRFDPENGDETLMAKQFKVLEKYTFVKLNTDEGKKSFNVDKNRNKEVLPYEDTRVSLLKSPGVDGSDYINASSIDSYQVRGMYIATQFPLENTVNDFWRMIWEKKSNCIVMLANVDEDPDKFKLYWTDKNNDAMLCGNFLVTLENEEKNDDFVTRNFKLKKSEGGETREVWHFNFLPWTEDKVPKNTAGMRQMIGKIQDVQRQGGNNPIVVHCSEGTGRTGAFCALVTSLERVKQDQSFNLFQTIMLQRIQRPKMVANVEQYKFCFQAVLDFLDSFDQYANFQDLRQ